jgi:hypothetical protein
MDGVVVVAGQFPAGSVVRLVRVADERVLRAEGGEEVDVRIVDAAGNVGFDQGIAVGDRFFAVGYAGGVPLEVRCTGQDADEVGATRLQPPIQPVQGTIGTQSAPQQVPAPLPPADTSIATGMAPAAAAATTEEPVAAETPEEPFALGALFVDSAWSPESALPGDIWVQTDLTTTDVVHAPLFNSSVAITPSELSERYPDWAYYDGPTEKAPDAAADPVPASVGSVPSDAGNESASASDASPGGESSDGETPSSITDPGPSSVSQAPSAGGPTPTAGSAPSSTPTAASLSQDGPPADELPPALDPAPDSQPDGVTGPADDVGSESSTAGSDAVTTSPAAATPDDQAVASFNPHTQLVVQAAQLGVENAADLDVDELRQAITEKNAIPAA